MSDEEKVERLKALYEEAETLREELGIEAWPGTAISSHYTDEWQIDAVGDGLGGATVIDSDVDHEVDATSDDAGDAGDDGFVTVREQVCATEEEAVILARAWAKERGPDYEDG